MSRINELHFRKKGSAFVLIADMPPGLPDLKTKLKSWTRAVIVHNDEKTRDPRATDPKRRDKGKPAGWGMPGGGIFDWKDPNSIIAHFVPPDCSCETSVEAVIREMFEESGLVIDTGDPRLVENLKNYHAEITGTQGKRFFAEAIAGRMLLIHEYAAQVEARGLIYPLGGQDKGNHTLFQFFVDANNLVDKNSLATKVDDAVKFNKLDPANNTGMTHWKSREELETYAASYVSLKRASDDEDERLREETRKDGKRRKLGLGHIYFSHLERMGFTVEQEQREDHLHIQP